jgi:hypothetical protein
LAKKIDLETKFSSWISNDKKRKAKYGQTLDYIKDYYDGTNSTVKK